MKSADNCFKHMFYNRSGTCLNMTHCTNWKHLGKLVLFIVILLFYCEVFVYYLVLIQCTWPQVETKIPHSTVKAMLLADTHLLGPKFGHWFDKLRREWQMYRTFQTAMTLHNPEVVFILGDIFDEGFYCKEEEFNNYVKRFHSIFYVPEKTKLYVTVGNHDIGFHYKIARKINERFENAFNASSVQMLTIKNNIFVLMNSMALQGDNCFLCKPAEQKLAQISYVLNCAKVEEKNKSCDKFQSLPAYSKPIFLQHFPLFRLSDSHCMESDSAPVEIKFQHFRETWECLSKKSTEKIFKLLEPRAVFTGHSHHGCLTLHNEIIPEWTLPSFSWRNKNNPSFLLGTFSPDNFAITKCHMPKESSVINTYIIGGLFILIYVFITRHNFFKKANYKDKL